jgi:hypothetical protein
VGLGSDPKRFLFCTAFGKTDVLSDRPMSQSGAYRMVRSHVTPTGGRLSKDFVEKDSLLLQ